MVEGLLVCAVPAVTLYVIFALERAEKGGKQLKWLFVDGKSVPRPRGSGR